MRGAQAHPRAGPRHAARGFRAGVLEQHGPEFFKGLKDAQYFTGFARTSLGPDFYRAAPGLKLVQLISAGYDRCDLAAARQANVPIANNGGASAKRQVAREHPDRFCLDGKVLRWASATEDRPREKLSTAGHRKLAALAAKEGMTPDELLGRLISAWRNAKK